MQILDPLETSLTNRGSHNPRLKVLFNDPAPKAPLSLFTSHSTSATATYGTVIETRFSAYIELLFRSTNTRISFKALPRIGIAPADRELALQHLEPAHAILLDYHPTISEPLSHLAIAWTPYELGPILAGNATKYLKIKGHKFYRAQWELSFSTPAAVEPHEHAHLLTMIQHWLQSLNHHLHSHNSPYKFMITEITTGETLSSSRSRKYLVDNPPDFDPLTTSTPP